MKESTDRSLRFQIYSLIESLKEKLRLIRHRVVRHQLQTRGELFKVSPHRALVFAPHADDETLGCGGFIALKHGLGAAIEVVILTDGSNCFGSLPSATANRLIERREKEAERAMNTLGIPKTQLHFLKQPDGQLASLAQRDQTHLTQLIELLERYRPQEILVPHRLDATADHEITFDLVQSALKATSLRPLVLQYSIWRLWNGPLLDFRVPSSLDRDKIYRLEISQVLEDKRKAFACYESQHSGMSEINAKVPLPPGFQKAFELKYEVFFGLDDPDRLN